MNTAKNNALGRKITAMAVCLALFTLGSALATIFAKQHIWLLAVLMTGAFASLGAPGAYMIRATWTRIDEERGKKHWDILNSRLLN